jgi:hypothetical protein
MVISGFLDKEGTCNRAMHANRVPGRPSNGKIFGLDKIV